MQHPTLSVVLPILWLSLLGAPCAPLAGQSGYHVDTRVGFKFRLPLKWRRWPVEKDRRFVTGHYVQIQDWPMPDTTRTHRPALRVLVLPKPKVLVGPTNQAGPPAAQPTAKPVPQPVVEFYRDYADYLARNVSGTLRTKSVEKGEVDGLPFEYFETTRTLDKWKWQLLTWVVTLERYSVAIEFMVLDDYVARLRQRLRGCFRSFRRVPVDPAQADADPWAPPLWVRDPARWKSLSDKQRLAERSRYAIAFQKLVTADIAPGFRRKDSRRFVILSSADARHTADIGKAAEGLVAWCDQHLDGVSRDPVIRCVIRVFGEREDYELYRSRSRRHSHYVPAIREIIVAPERRRPTELGGLADLSEGMLHYYLHDKDIDLHGNLPEWLRSALEGYLRSSRLQRGKVVFEAGDRDKNALRDAVRRKRLETVRGMITEGMVAVSRVDRRWWTQRTQRTALARFILEPGRKAKDRFPPDFLAAYLRKVVELQAKFAVPPAPPGAGVVPGASEAQRKKQDEAEAKTRKQLLAAVNQAVCPWDADRWVALQRAFVNFTRDP